MCAFTIIAAAGLADGRIAAQQAALQQHQQQHSVPKVLYSWMELQSLPALAWVSLDTYR
jgi:hypothetical protein